MSCFEQIWQGLAKELSRLYRRLFGVRACSQIDRRGTPLFERLRSPRTPGQTQNVGCQSGITSSPVSTSSIDSNTLASSQTGIFAAA